MFFSTIIDYISSHKEVCLLVLCVLAVIILVCLMADLMVRDLKVIEHMGFIINILVPVNGMETLRILLSH